MSNAPDLAELNHALRQLVSLQLEGSISADEAFQQRRQLLDAVDDSWEALREQAPSVEFDLASHARWSPVERLQAFPAQLINWLTRRTWRLPLSALLLILALSTFWYVSSL